MAEERSGVRLGFDGGLHISIGERIGGAPPIDDGAPPIDDGAPPIADGELQPSELPESEATAVKDEEVAAVMGQPGGWHVSPSVQPLEPSPVVTVVSTEPPPPPLSQTRTRREQKSTKKVLTLADFPPGECEVLTPRVGVGVAPTWLPVVDHTVTDG